MQRGVRAERGGDRALLAQLHAQAAARRALRVLRRRERRRKRGARGFHEAHAERRARVPHAALAPRVVHCGLSRAHLQPHVHGMRCVARLVSLLATRTRTYVYHVGKLSLNFFYCFNKFLILCIGRTRSIFFSN